MTEHKIDFEGLNTSLLGRVGQLMIEWLPGGKLEGKEYVCADLTGGRGTSTKVNQLTGVWSDFATNESGGDLIALYARINNLGQAEAAKLLIQEYGISTEAPILSAPEPSRPKVYPLKLSPSTPPWGNPTYIWTYRDKAGEFLFYIVRYDNNGKKFFCPWVFMSDNTWHKEAYPAPRPLYGLDLLAKVPRDRAIMLVEGEKACDAARLILRDEPYLVMTWPGGAQAINKVDFGPIHGRPLLLWPDADNAGIAAMGQIAAKLNNECPSIKILGVTDREIGWDAADAYKEGMSYEGFFDWARPKAKLFTIQGDQKAFLPDVMQPEDTEPNEPHKPVNIKQKAKVIQNNITAPADQDGMPSESNRLLWDRLGLALNGSGNPIINEDNVVRIFENEKALAGKLWFDDFHRSVYLNDHQGGYQIKDMDISKLTIMLQRNFGMARVTESIVRRSLYVIADSIHKNEPKDYFESLEWDGTPRIHDFFHTHLGSELTNYTRAASKNFWVSMIARIYNPGCIMRTMVILQGKQWAGKSTVFSIIGGKWYSEILESINSNNFFQSLHGKLLLEFGDMSGMDRAEVNRIKQVISCRMDRFRAPYDRTPDDHLRQCVLVSTTNEGEFLRDDTGGTRFWPIRVGKINHDDIIRDRDQLFAEAVYLYKQKENWHIMPTEETEAVQESYRQKDVWEDIILEQLTLRASQGKHYFTVQEVGEEILRIPRDRFHKSEQIRIGRCLRSVGLVKKMIREEERVFNCWAFPSPYQEEGPTV